MKNKKKIILLLIIVFILIISFIVSKNINKNNDLNNSLLVTSSYDNYGRYPIFKGNAILDNGIIYTWDETGEKFNDKQYNLETEDGLKKFIIHYGNRSFKKISSKDLEKIKSYISKLTNEEVAYEPKCMGADMGTEAIDVYNNKGEKFRLRERGNCDGSSNGENAKKLLKIIEKYL